MMFTTVFIIFLAVLFLLSPWLVKKKWMTGFQREKLRHLIIYRLPQKIFTFLVPLVIVAVAYTILYFIAGDFKRVTETDLSRVTVYLPSGWQDLNLDDMGIKYSLSGWWNILFLAGWLSLMRYLYKISYRFKFPYSRLEYSGYVLLLVLAAIMIYFSYLGNSPLYGLIYNIMYLVFYTLAHVLACLLLWFFGFERV